MTALRQTRQSYRSPSATVIADNEDSATPVDALELQQAVWEQLKEEHHEVCQQFPLSLQRQLMLMKDLEDQTQEYMADLVPVLEKYVAARKQLAAAALSSDKPPSHSAEMFSQTNGSAHPLQPHSSSSSADAPRASSAHVGPSERTSDTLARLAWLSEETTKAANEKLHISKAIINSVNRHKRLLDEAIKEQETSIALGVRVGTHVALPELVIPRATRPPPIASSPPPDFFGDTAGPDMLVSQPPEEPMQENMEPSDPRAEEKPNNRKRGRDRNRKKQRLTIKVPAPVQPVEQAEEEDTTLYCTCRRPSFGEMIACDSETCPIEWYHLECLGLSQAPTTDTWYCDTCRAR